MRAIFPVKRSVPAWHRAVLGPLPFSCDPHAARAAFFGPASRLCRRPVTAEKDIPRSLPASLRRRLVISLRLWQASQEIAAAYARGGGPLPGMDMPMTLNFAMALGNYSRFFLFSGPRLPARAALALHAAFSGEMAAMPAAMALPRPRGRFCPSASARRLALAFAAALKGAA